MSKPLAKKTEKDDISLNATWEIFVFYGDSDIAIFYSNLRHWIKKNESNGDMIDKHGVAWTYHSVTAFQKTFHMWSLKHIRTMLRKLEKDFFITSGEYRDGKYSAKKYKLGPRKIV